MEKTLGKIKITAFQIIEDADAIKYFFKRNNKKGIQHNTKKIIDACKIILKNLEKIKGET